MWKLFKNNLPNSFWQFRKSFRIYKTGRAYNRMETNQKEEYMFNNGNTVSKGMTNIREQL